MIEVNIPLPGDVSATAAVAPASTVEP